MGLKFDNTDIYALKYNNVSLTQLNYNGTPVWYALTSCVISGIARVGKTFTATVSPAEVQTLCSYQWYRGNNLIRGATSSTYITTTSDRGYKLKCVATIGSAQVTSNESDKILQLINSISISGIAEEGYTLTSSLIPSDATGTYRWYRGNTAISGATNPTYTLVHNDAGYKIKCIFTASGNYTGTVNSNQTDTVIGWNSATNPYSISFSGTDTYKYASPSKPVRNLVGTIRCGHGSRCGNGDWCSGFKGQLQGLNVKTGEWETIVSAPSPDGDADRCPPSDVWGSKKSFTINDNKKYSNIRAWAYWSTTGSFVTTCNVELKITSWEIQS